jgi:hypothetical protein
MSGDKTDGITVAGVPFGIVKGGTTSSAYDAEVAKTEDDARRRRLVQDAMYAKAQGPKKPGESVRLGSNRLINESSPRLVLSYMKKDKTVRQQAVSEIATSAIPDRPEEIEANFTMVCPRCIDRGIPQGQAQMHIRDSHRKFWLDERKRGVVMVEYGWGEKQAVLIAGTVTCEDVIRCSNHNCDFACRIDDSKVYEV